MYVKLNIQCSPGSSTNFADQVYYLFVEERPRLVESGERWVRMLD